MNANELANELDKLWDKSFRNPMVSKSADMLRQQAEEIKTLKAELEDCTCQGGHSQAYLKVKGKK